MSVEEAAAGIISAAAVSYANWQTAAERSWQHCLALKQWWQETLFCCFLTWPHPYAYIIFCLWYIFCMFRLIILSTVSSLMVICIRKYCQWQFYVVDLLVHSHFSWVVTRSGCGITAKCQCHALPVIGSHFLDWHGHHTFMNITLALLR